MNAMMYICGTDRDYDNWAALGNPGWEYKNILPLIKKHEGNNEPQIVGDGSYHGTSGPLTVGSYNSDDYFGNFILSGFQELGYKKLTDYNSGTYNGYVVIQGTIKNGERRSAYQAFVQPMKNRKNLFIMKNSYVTKVLLSGNKATGFNVRTSKGECFNIPIKASKEVIISAGALTSPKILLQSGIGKKSDLEPFGIKQVKNLPVGDNLQDHVYGAHWFQMSPNNPSMTILDVLKASEQYYFYRNGSLINLNTLNFQGFINLDDPNAKYPEFQYIFFHFFKNQQFFAEILENLAYKQEVIDRLVAINQNYELVAPVLILLNPKSRGSVKLSSSDPTAHPKIVTGYFSAAEDLDLMVRATRKLEDLINTSPFQYLSASMIKFDLPVCNSLPYPSDAYRKCHLKYFSTSVWHPTATNTMAPDGVVDYQLKVHGISGLRVADASIMPRITTGNTQCPTYMIGEKAAAMIKATWSL